MKEFKMSQDEMDEIIEVNKTYTGVFLGGPLKGFNLQDRINAIWDRLGVKYGFDPKSVKGPGPDGPLSFIANEITSESN